MHLGPQPLPQLLFIKALALAMKFMHIATHRPAPAHCPAPPNEYGSRIIEVHYFSGVGLMCFGTAAPPGGRRHLFFWDQAVH